MEEPVTTAVHFERDKLDYEQTLESVRQLTEIRFKLLAFVPSLSAAAIALVTKRVLPGVEAAVGVLGFLLTLGITFYDQRNSILYDDLIGRAKGIETNVLRFQARSGDAGEAGGAFADRPAYRPRLFGVIEIWHDRALAIVYGAVLGGWTFPIAVGGGAQLRWAAAVSALVGAAAILELQRLRGEGPLARTWWIKRTHRRRERRQAEREYATAQRTAARAAVDRQIAQLERWTDKLS